MVGFEQASIKVERQQEFEQLRTAIVRAFAPGTAEKFLKRMQSASLRVRDFDGVLAGRVLEQVDKALKSSGTSAGQLYRSLPLSDQAQMREFYLLKIEEVDAKLRTKFQKLYRYY